MFDIVNELNAVRRETGRAPEAHADARTIVLRRTYAADVADVWDALTDPDRISRWFLPITGDLRLGGTYQFKGNAGGEILRCEPPRMLRVSWIFGGSTDLSEVEVRLTPGEGETTDFELEHVAVVPPEMWDQFGPGAVGVGWELGLFGLSLHLKGGSIDDPEAWAVSPEGRQYAIGSSELWGTALAAAGGTAEHVAAAVANTSQFYAPDPESAAPENAEESKQPD
jgi:uncharacterized protein YndB with AHSA1/START domain